MIMQTVHDIEKDGILVITESQIALLKHWLITSKAKKVKAKWTIYRPSKTTKQNKAFWGLVMPYAKKAFDDAGIDVMNVPLNQEQIKDVLYKFCGGVGDNGESKRISEMDITEIKRTSKPGRRIYSSVDKLPHVLAGYGIAIVSTSKGVMSDKNCRRDKVGGEILCTVN